MRAAFSELSDEERQEYINEHMVLVYSAVKKYSDHKCRSLGIQTEDLIQEGSLALVQSAYNYDPNSLATFYSFAYRRVHGAIIDFIRRNHVAPRGTKARKARIDEIYDRYYANEGRRPTDAELCRELNCKLWQLKRVIRGIATLTQPVRIELVASKLATEKHAIEDKIEHHEDLCRLSEYISELPENLRMMVHHRYFEGLNNDEIARETKIPRHLISSLHMQSTAILRDKFQSKDRIGPHHP